MAWVAVTVGVIGAYSANQSAKATNRASEQAKESERRRYLLQSGIAKNQMEEQQGMALEKMTDISRAFIKAKGTATASQAESGVGGNVQQRMKSIQNTKASEAKGKVAKEIDTNVINIANGMLAKKVDTDAIIAEAESRKQNVAMNTIIGGINGAVSGYSLGKSIKGVSNDLLSNAPDVEQDYFGRTYTTDQWGGV
jgi:hypothetical protein